MKHPIPDKALDDCLAFVGTRGSGKTYTALALIERLLNTGARVVHIDPLGVAWGLRLDKKGKKPSKYNIVIFGGPHGDIDITENSGSLIGETVAKMAESCIIDTSEFKTKAADVRFMRDFTTAFYSNATKEPVHIVFDEVDMYAPQQVTDKEGGANKLLGMMETIVRRGRVKGLIPWMISQRPAVVNKNILTQVDGMIFMKLTSPQDRAAVGLWIKGQADVKEGERILGKLPTKQTGEGFVWIPGRNILDEVKFPERDTFDSSRTPKRGERKRKPKKLKTIDLGKLKDRLAAVEKEAKENDPSKLKIELRMAQNELHGIRLEMAKKPISDPKALNRARSDAYDEGWNAHVKKVATDIGDLAARGKFAVKTTVDFGEELDALAKRTLKKADKIFHLPGTIHAPIVLAPPMPIKASTLKPIRLKRGQSVEMNFVGTAADNGRLPTGTLKPLSALVSAYPAGMTKVQWAVSTGIKSKGSTMSVYISRLRTVGLVTQRGNEFFATEEAVKAVGNSVAPLPQPGPDLIEFWCRKISGAGPVLKLLARNYPATLTKEDISNQLQINPQGSTLSVYLSRLMSPKLITKDGGRYGASPEIMGR